MLVAALRVRTLTVPFTRAPGLSHTTPTRLNLAVDWARALAVVPVVRSLIVCTCPSIGPAVPLKTTAAVPAAAASTPVTDRCAPSHANLHYSSRARSQYDLQRHEDMRCYARNVRPDLGGSGARCDEPDGLDRGEARATVSPDPRGWPDVGEPIGSNASRTPS
jgi:hypothetical protein